MKRFLILFLLVLVVKGLFAKENTKVTAALREKYAMVQYHTDCDGWYLLRFSENGQTYYAFSDNAGNVIATYATEYELHNGYIRMCIVDLDKKIKHDEWLRLKAEYDRDYYKYTQVKEQYDKELSEYNAKVSNARSYANTIWENKRQEACKAAVAAEQQRQQAMQNNNDAGSQLGAAIGSLILAGAGYYQRICDEAANKVAFDPIFNQVIRDRGLSYPPSKPYNPEPHYPTEPSSGYEWHEYSFMQPCPYSFVEYAAVQERGGYADVKKDGKYGLVDYYFKEILPCTGNTSLKAGKVFGCQVVRVDGKYGMLDENSKWIMDISYSEIKESGTNVLLAKESGKWQFFKSNGTPVSSNLYDELTALEDNLLCRIGNTYGVCSKSGVTVMPLVYSSIVAKDGVLYATKDGLVGVFDKNGKTILANQFHTIEKAYDMFICKKNGMIGSYTLDGNPLLPLQFDKIEKQYGYLICTKNEKMGIYDVKGKQLYDCLYQNLRVETVENVKFLHTKIQGRWGVLDFETGNQIIRNAFSNIEIVTMNKNPYFKVYQLDKVGLYGLLGQLLVPCEYEKIQLKHIDQLGDIFETTQNGKFSLFNALDGLCLLPQNDYTSWKYEPPFFYVIQKDKMGVYDIALGELIGCKYDNIKYDEKYKIFWIQQDGKQGFVTVKDEPLFDFVPYNLSVDGDHIKIFDKNTSKFGACDFAGNIVVQAKKKTYTKCLETVNKLRNKPKRDFVKNNSEPLRKIATDYKDFNDREQAELKIRGTFDYFARHYVERVINDWQKKGEFEKTEDWQRRVNADTRAVRIREFTKRAELLYVNEEKKKVKLNIVLEQYDPNNEVFMVTDTRFGRMLVSVPYENAEAFRAAWSSVTYVPEYFIDNGEMAISKMTFTMPDGSKYYYSNEQALNYEVADIKYNFDPLDLQMGRSREFMNSVKVLKPATEVVGSSALVSYNNDFAEKNNPDVDDSFPFALFRVKLEGNSDAIRKAKNIIRLYLGQMFTVEKTVTKYSNQILFLVRKSVRNVSIDCGDGCPSVLLWQGALNANSIYDATINVE